MTMDKDTMREMIIRSAKKIIEDVDKYLQFDFYQSLWITIRIDEDCEASINVDCDYLPRHLMDEEVGE